MAGYPWDSETFKQYPTRVISDTNILELQGTEKVLIGRTIAWCNDIENTCGEAIAKAEQYYNRLVELGDIAPKESTEEMLLKAMKAINYLTEKVESLEKENRYEPNRSSIINDGTSIPASGGKGEKRVSKVQPGQGGANAGNS